MAKTMKINKLISGIFLAAVIEFSIIGGFIYNRANHLPDKTVEIYTVFHKPWKIYQNDIVIPIHAGRALNTKRAMPLLDKMIGDDTGDNISKKNQSYSELTALYWIWKNSKADYVGLMHYQRYLNLHNVLPSPPQCEDIFCALGLSADNVKKIMKDYDVIVTSYDLDMTQYNYYARWHFVENLDLAIDYLHQNYPLEANAADHVLMSKHFIAYNIFITKKEVLNRYAEWIFKVLADLEDKLLYDHDLAYFGCVIPRHPTYQLRAPGYLAERLFNIWLIAHKNELRILEVPIFYVGNAK